MNDEEVGPSVIPDIEVMVERLEEIHHHYRVSLGWKTGGGWWISREVNHGGGGAVGKDVRRRIAARKKIGEQESRQGRARLGRTAREE
jgi:hypothetical protein